MRRALITLLSGSGLVACAFALDYDALRGGDAGNAPDVTTESGTLAEASSGDSASDGGTSADASGFCASSIAKRCDDFSGTDVASFWEKSLVGGTARTVDEAYVSPPRALRIGLDAGATNGAYLRHTVDAQGRVRVAATLRLDKMVTTNTTILLALENATSAPGYEFIQTILVVNDAGKLGFIAQWRPLEGGTTVGDGQSISESPYEFHRYELEIDPAAQEARVIVDGVAKPAVPWPFAPRSMLATVGITYLDPAPTSELVVFYDDAIIDW